MTVVQCTVPSLLLQTICAFINTTAVNGNGGAIYSGQSIILQSPTAQQMVLILM